MQSNAQWKLFALYCLELFHWEARVPAFSPPGHTTSLGGITARHFGLTTLGTGKEVSLLHIALLIGNPGILATSSTLSLDETGDADLFQTPHLA